MAFFSETNTALLPETAPQSDDLTAEEHDLRQRVRAYLRSRVPDACSVEIRVSGPTVVLRGEVPSSRAKWLCLSCCRRVAGVVMVVDELTVAQGPARRCLEAAGYRRRPR